MNDQFRIERDSMGEVKVPVGVRYGAQTQRAVDNFTISAEPMPDRFIEALLNIKQAAARANRELGLLDDDKAEAIITAVSDLLDSDFSRHFPVPILQTGSGTSTNMNANEVISFMAAEQGVQLSPNDHVNLGQSSNDVIPSALLVAAARQISCLVIPALEHLGATIRAVAQRNGDVIKTGRTHLMDALPIRLAAELEGWASQVDDVQTRLLESVSRLSRLPLGGTAVGSGANCHPDFAPRALTHLSAATGMSFTSMGSLYQGLSSIDPVLETSGHLKIGAAVLMKIANDLRWMNSGPHAGIGEITLPALQPGSSIMPAKVNPVIPEAVCMAAAHIIGNDATITIAAQAGSFQINTMLPIAAAAVLESGELMAGSAASLADKAITGMVINRLAMAEPLALNPILVTALVPYIGYLAAADIGKQAQQERRPVLEIAKEQTDLDTSLLERILDPAFLADGSKNR
jgi:fumarate hydratase class II